MPKIVITKDIESNLINCYIEENITCTELAKRFRLKRQSVIYRLKKSGIQIRQLQGRRFNLNHNYFNIIDTEEKAYFLGFLYADGYNYEKENVVSIKLQKDDKEILEKFKDMLRSELKIYFQKGVGRKDSYSLSVRSEKLSKDLSKLGCFQRKSLTLRFPTENQVPKRLLKDFLRGYFDGDGTFGRYKANRHKYLRGKVGICSTVFFLEEVKKIINGLGISCYISKVNRRKTTTRQLGINGNYNMMVFLDWLYGDCSISLKRKYDKYIKIKKEIEYEQKL